MYKAIILPLAKEDIRDAAYWYNDKQKGLGKRFTREVRSALLHIRQHPKAIAIRYDDVRCAVLDIFPFMIHFSVDEQRETIIILAVFHTSLHPDRWKKR